MFMWKKVLNAEAELAKKASVHALQKVGKSPWEIRTIVFIIASNQRRNTCPHRNLYEQGVSI